jgi:P-type E1-E2 ATPase
VQEREASEHTPGSPTEAAQTELPVAPDVQPGPTRISESATEAQIEAALAGEPARPLKPTVADIRHIVLEVTGMTCPSCALRVERAIRGSPGVITTSANLALGLAIVELDADEARLGNLVAWEERLGSGKTPGPLPHMEQPIIDEIANAGYRAVLRREVAIRRHPPLIERWLFARFGLSAVILATIAAMGLERPHGPAMALLGLIVLLGAGIPILLDAFRRARYLSVNSSSLTTVGAVGAYAVALNEALLRGNAVGAAPLFEGAAAVITTVLLAQLLRRRVFDQLLDRFHRALRITPDLAPGIIKAQISKGERQRTMDGLVRVGLPVTFVFVSIVMLAHLSMGHTLLTAVIPALTVISATSFTALGLAVYLATMTGIQRAAERRVLFRDTGVMDDLSELTTLVTTKSVVAQGTPVVQRAVFFHEDHQEVMALAAGCEAGSNQPAGRAIYSYALQQGIRPVDVRRVEVLRGYGLAARTKGRRILIGSRVLMERDHVSLDQARMVEAELAGQTLAYMAVNGTLVAVFAMVDRARPGVTQIVRTLRRQGVQSILLTGDPSRAARAMAREAGMEEVMAEIPPNRRAHEVSDTWVTNGVLAIGGDPNRDGELLQVGDVSIAVSEVVPPGQPPGVWLVRGTFADLLPAIEIARYSHRVSYQNAAITAIWNALWVFVGAIGVLGIHGPVIAGGAAALVFSMLSVSSRRLLGRLASS